MTAANPAAHTEASLLDEARERIRALEAELARAPDRADYEGLRMEIRILRETSARIAPLEQHLREAVAECDALKARVAELEGKFRVTDGWNP